MSRDGIADHRPDATFYDDYQPPIGGCRGYDYGDDYDGYSLDFGFY